MEGVVQHMLERSNITLPVHLKCKDLDPYFKWVQWCSVGTTKLQGFLQRARDRAIERHYRPGALGFQAKREEWDKINNAGEEDSKMNKKQHLEQFHDHKYLLSRVFKLAAFTRPIAS